MAIPFSTIATVVSDVDINEIADGKYKIVNFRVRTGRFGMPKSLRDRQAADFFPAGYFVGERSRVPDIQRGDRVYITGNVLTEEWETRKGNKASKPILNLTSIVNIEKEIPTAEGEKKKREEAPTPADDDIPF